MFATLTPKKLLITTGLLFGACVFLFFFSAYHHAKNECSNSPIFFKGLWHDDFIKGKILSVVKESPSLNEIRILDEKKNQEVKVENTDDNFDLYFKNKIGHEYYIFAEYSPTVPRLFIRDCHLVTGGSEDMMVSLGSAINKSLGILFWVSAGLWIVSTIVEARRGK